MITLSKAILLLLAVTSLIQARERHSCGCGFRGDIFDQDSSSEYPVCNHGQYQQENPPELCDVQEDFQPLTSGQVISLTTGTASADASTDVTVAATTTYPSIRIYANYDNLIQEAPASFATYFQTELAPAVISYFQGALQVKYPVTGSLTVTSNTVCSLTTPTALKNGVAADFAVLFDSYSESSSIVATTSYCQLASGTKRPVVGKTIVNRYQMKEANGDAVIHERNVYQLLHELTHTFGFSQYLYSYFVDANGNTMTGHVKTTTIDGASHTVIDVAALTAKLQTFHSCSTLPGAIMASGDASHWDKRMYLYELMQSGAISGKRVSQFSLGMIEASGWYVVNYDYAEPYFYAQNEGCTFVNGACTYNEFCTGSSKGCSFMGGGGGYCGAGSNMDGCSYVIPSDYYNCKNGTASLSARLPTAEAYGPDAGSKCFTGTLYTRSSTTPNSFCFKYNCVGTGTATQLQVTVGSTVVTCTQAGSISVSGYVGALTCPDPQTFCSTVGLQYCPRGCLGRGTCVDNKCQCNTGFTGADCSFTA